nr:hypothetical protein B0A51_11680 [Rachicladosporium sp. CCFEE 5018]
MPTAQAFVHDGNWDAETDGNQAMKFMGNYTRNYVDNRDFMKADAKIFDKWHTKDFVFQKSDGTRTSGADDTAKALQEVYAIFSGGHKHRPTSLACWDEKDGSITMFGHAKVYVGFEGHDKTVTDDDGDKWNAVMEGGFRFWYVKDESGVDGIKIKETRIYADPMPAIGYALKNGILSPKDLGLA